MSTTTDKLGLFKIIDLDDLLLLDIHDTMLKISNNFQILDDVSEQQTEKYENSKPISGTWEKKKRLWNNNPTAGNFVGWVCVRSGVAAPNWIAQTSYLVGDEIVPTTDNGHYYKCVVAGTSGLIEPAFPTTSGQTVSDNAWSSFWNGEIAYSLDDLIVPTTSNGYYYKCTIAGISDIAEPTWPTIEGQTVTDGTVIWTCYKIVQWKEMGTSALFKGFGAIEE